MARTRKSFSPQIDIAHSISVGILADVCPRALIDEVLNDTGKGSQRERLLPAPAVVYYIMALALWREAPLEEVMRVVRSGLQWLNSEDSIPAQPCKAALSQARSRLGPTVMKELAAKVLRPLAERDSLGAWYHGLRVVAVDGTSMDVADETANANFFGYPGASRGESAFPQIHVLALVECGTHAVIGAEHGPCRRSEQEMAESLLPATLRPDMLLLADRNFYGYPLWQTASACGCTLLWRVKANLKLARERILPDGSYLSRVYSSKDRTRQDGQPVRVIEYTLDNDVSATPETYRLITNITDHTQAPADELAALYHERWEVEEVFSELKTRLCAGGHTTLRSKTPALVEQELWGLLLAHFAIRQLIVHAGLQRTIDPDKLSFMNAVRVIRRKLPQAAALPP
jgi:hypothetical protein